MENLFKDFDNLSRERGFKFLTWNIRSLYNKFDEFTALVSKLGCELISLCETWLGKNTLDGWILLQSYNLFRQDRTLARRGGGLAIYVKDKYNCNTTKYKHLCTSQKEIEVLVLELCLPATKPIIVLNCYRPPAENVDVALKQIRQILEQIPVDNEVYLMGDLNIDYQCKGSPTFNKLQLLERTFQLTQYINTPTRVSKKSSSIIDHIYSNSHLIFRSGTLNINSSDHFPCYIIRKKNKIKHTVTTFTCRKLKHFQHAFFRNRLEDLDWRPYYDCTDPNKAWDMLYSMMLKVIDEHYPEATFTNFPVKAAWLNADIFEAMVKRDDAFDTAKTTKLPKDWEKAKKLRNKVVDMCTNAKNDHTRENLHKNKHNPKNSGRLFYNFGVPTPAKGKNL